MRHSKVEPASLEENVKLAVVLLVGVAGLLLMVVSGGVVSIIHVQVAGVGSGFNARSTALTSKV